MEQHLTIREVKNEIKRLENELNVYLTKKNINLYKLVVELILTSTM